MKNSLTCERCGADLRVVAHTMSRFNTQIVCTPCHDDERRAPNYVKARDTESEAVRRGEFNFPGIGLAPEDEAFLAEAREQRAQAQ